MNSEEIYALGRARLIAKGLVLDPLSAIDASSAAVAPGPVTILAAVFGKEGVWVLSVSELEILQNSEPRQISDLLDARIFHIMASIRDRFKEAA